MTRPVRQQGLDYRDILEAVRAGNTAISGDVLSLLRDDSVDPHVRGRAAWALGKLRIRSALPSIVRFLSDDALEVRLWSAWALGELGDASLQPLLRRAIAQEHADDVRGALGGALKKIGMDSVRAPRRAVLERLKPPPTPDERITLILQRIAGLEWESGRDEIIRLRGRIKELDPLYFEAYMQWIRALPDIKRAADDRRFVYA